eukprot:symbB.v1.2.006257.t1/scaffold370.1/size393101/23
MSSPQLASSRGATELETGTQTPWNQKASTWRPPPRENVLSFRLFRAQKPCFWTSRFCHLTCRASLSMRAALCLQSLEQAWQTYPSCKV